MSEQESKSVLTFQGVLGMEMLEKETNEGTVFEIYKGGTKKRLWALFVNDRVSAMNAMYTSYVGTLDRVLKEAQERLKDPERAAEAIENKAGEKAASPEPVPIFAKKMSIVE